jgi:hypothetical protein
VVLPNEHERRAIQDFIVGRFLRGIEALEPNNDAAAPPRGRSLERRRAWDMPAQVDRS